jgi:sugar O-acyltransferase (sialic acid O-acetyltransferase NeuD family)
MNNHVWNGLPIAVFGSSGISRETAFLIEDINNHSLTSIFDFLGFVEDNSEKIGKKVSKYEIVTCDDQFADFSKEFPVLGVALPIGLPKIKRKIHENVLVALDNIAFPNLIHPSVSLHQDTVKMGIGNIVTAGVRFTCDIEIGNFNLFNLNSTIGHDVIIEDFCVINPGATVSGGVKIKNEVLIGTGANILQYNTLNTKSVVGAGAVVSKNVSENTVVVGVPAKPLKR